MNQEISHAIKNKKLLQFDYDEISRTVEPYCYGTTEQGNEALRGFQIVGHASKGKMAWKLYDLSKASQIKVLDEGFQKARKEYKKTDKVILNILAQV